MKRLLTVLVAVVYSVPASIFLTIYTLSGQNAPESALPGVFWVPMSLMAAVCVLVAISIICALVAAASSRCLPLRTVMVFKLCLIPFYIVNFLCWAFASMVFHIALVIWPIVPFIIAYTYLTMLGTSAHIIAKLLTLRRSGAVTTKQLVIHSIFQLIFAADVIDSIYLAINRKRLEPDLEQ